jgi:hypothetical protein
MTRFDSFLALLAGSLLALPAGAEIVLTDVTADVGIHGNQYRSDTGHSLGMNWIDYDRDGWPDLFAVAGGPGLPTGTLHLFHNLRDGTFDRADDLLPVLPEVEMSGSRFADYDRDGDPDIFIYTDNPDFHTTEANLPDGPPNLLLRNLWVENGRQLVEGEPLFEEVAAEAGLEDLVDPPFGDLPAYRSKTAGFVDYDRDGCIDLFVGHLVMNSGGSAVNKDRLYRNLCDGTFEDVTAASGVNPGTDPDSYRGALAFIAAHLDSDLWPELYVINAAGADPQPYINDLLYRNLGGVEGAAAFAEVTGTMAGIGDDAQAGMGADVADVDHDGDWDLYISDLLNTTRDELPLGNVLYLGNGDGTLADNSAPAAGVVGHNSWGVNFFDVDHDTFEDLFVATTSAANTEILYRNDGDGTFTNVADSAGIVTGNSRGSAVADYDRDGDLDLAVINQGGPLQLFRNDTTDLGSWLQLELVGTESNPDAIGTVVEVTIGGVVLRRQIEGGSSAHSQDSPTVHFGLGDATVATEVRIRWPSGAETVLVDQPVNRFVKVIEGALFVDGFESGELTGWSAVVP